MKKHLTVSIVDDEADLRKHIAGYLSAAGNIRCISTEEALAHLPQDKPDVILMDINLGEMDGIEFIREARRHTPFLPIVAMSGRLDTPDIGLLNKLGVQTVTATVKPVLTELALP